MNTAPANLNFDLFALAYPKTKQDCLALAYEILAELDIIDGHFDRAIARCEAQLRERSYA